MKSYTIKLLLIKKELYKLCKEVIALIVKKEYKIMVFQCRMKITLKKECLNLKLTTGLYKEVLHL